jgi:hypothetical protein
MKASVYVIVSNEHPDGLFKVGVSVSPKIRLRNIASSSSSSVRLAFYSTFKSASEAYRVESIAHRDLHCRSAHGEWFSGDHRDAIDMVRSAGGDCFVVEKPTGEEQKPLREPRIEAVIDHEIMLREIATITESRPERRPFSFPLPKKGERDEYFNLSRAAYLTLWKRGLIKMVEPPGRTTRLICYESVLALCG